MEIVLDKIESDYYEDGKHYVKASMFADNTDIVLPTNGSNVKGLSANVFFAPNSSIFTATGNIIFHGLSDWGSWL